MIIEKRDSNAHAAKIATTQPRAGPASSKSTSIVNSTAETCAMNHTSPSCAHHHKSVPAKKNNVNQNAGQKAMPSRCKSA